MKFGDKWLDLARNKNQFILEDLQQVFHFTTSSTLPTQITD